MVGAGGGQDFDERPDPQELSGPQENAFSKDLADARSERTAQRGSDNQGERPEINVNRLDAGQRESLRKAVDTLADEFAKADNGLAGMAQKRQRSSSNGRCQACSNKEARTVKGSCEVCKADTSWSIEKICRACSVRLMQCQVCRNDLQDDEFDQWYKGYEAKVLGDLRRSVDDVGQALPFRTSLPVQVYGQPGDFKPETLKVQMPPNPADVFISGSHAGIRLHSDKAGRERSLKQTPAAHDPFSTGVSMHEVIFRMKRAGVYK